MRSTVHRRLISELYKKSSSSSSTSSSLILSNHFVKVNSRNVQSCSSLSVFSAQFPRLQQRHFHIDSPLRKELVEFKLADIGEGINEVVIKEWYVKVGDQVRQFDSICEVQSDKASVTITSRFDGTITKLFYEPEDMARVGKPLVELQIETADKMVDELNDQDAPSTSSTTDSTGNSLNIASNSNENNSESKSTGVNSDTPLSLSAGGDKVLTTPAVRRLASEHNINLQEVQATGKDGRILKEDVLRHLEQLKQTTSNAKTSEGTTENVKLSSTATNMKESLATLTKEKVKEAESTVSLEADQVHRLKGIQKAMVKSMTAALRIPHFGLSDELNLSKLVKLRAQLKKQAEQRGIHLSYLPFFIKAASLALRQYPVLNATFDADNEQIIYRASHNIGVAVDSPAGLIVPNIKNVQNLTILEIAQQLNHLQHLASNGQLTNKELTGGTFTLSNIGSIGGSFGIPVILPPEVAIGAIGRIQEVPRFDDKDNLVKAQVLNVVWCADHRVIEGATMTRFNNLWKSYLENPISMITELK